MPDWSLFVVAGVGVLGAAALIATAMWDARMERRMRDELLYGWWRVGDGDEQDR